LIGHAAQPLVRLAVVFNEAYFAEFSEACTAHLRKHGIAAETFDGIPEGVEWDAILVIGIHKFTRIPRRAGVPLLGVQTEQLPLSGGATGRLLRNLRRFNAVRGYYRAIFDWNPCYTARQSGRVIFIPYGCTPVELKPATKDWDVVFIGNIAGSSRRAEILDHLKKRFSLFPDYSPGFGVRKSAAIGSSRVCLNVHYYDDCGFESPRVFDYLAHGGFVLSERVESTRPFEVGRDLDDFGDLHELIAKLEHYLRNDTERERIAVQGRQTALQNGYDKAANIIAAEVHKAIGSSQGSPASWIAWATARLKSERMELVDRASLQRRRLTALIEK